MARKFNDGDRSELVTRLEKFYSIKLQPYRLPNSNVRKLFSDDVGNLYCVFGGGVWHGIQLSMLRSLQAQADKTFLIIGVLDTEENNIKVFLSPLKQLIEKPELLGKPNKFDQVAFSLEISGSEARLNKVSDFKMTKIMEYEPGNDFKSVEIQEPEENIEIQELEENDESEAFVEAEILVTHQPPIESNDGSAESYTLADAGVELFCDQDRLAEIITVLRKKKNIVLQGPPGVGKSFMAKKLAYATIGKKAPEQVCMIQFHQAYGYEEFVRGWRPKADGSFEIKDGVFLRFCEKAVRNPERPYFFLIDEINRGNLSRIFGETMLLIESDKRSPEYAVELSHQKADEGAFFIPANVHLIGMMNTADRSLAMVDYALRRRFVFFDIEPAFSYERFKQHLQKRNMSEKLIEAIILRMNKINEEIVSDTGSLGAGYRIGHSFFCPDHTTDLDETWYRQVIRYEIEPLLREYWFDKPDNVAKAVEFLSQDI